MTHAISCNCGKVKGKVKHTKYVNRCVCYCQDCQAFARFLKQENKVLDKMGGTDIIQTIPDNITLSEGIENLACIRLTSEGLLRWYAACCNTPIGNTPPNPQMSFVGLIHSCLSSEENSLDKVFGPNVMHVSTKYAIGEDKPKSTRLLSGNLRVLAMILRARLDGSYKRTPFFTPDSTVPIVKPKVLSEQEFKDVMDGI